MEISNQKNVWDNIAEEWYEFKAKASPENLDFVKKQKGKILDLGCGAGRHFTKSKAKIYAVDFSGEMIRFAKKRAKNLGIKEIDFAVAEAWKLPFEDEFFDAAIFISAQHCIKGKVKRKKSLKELFRVLKKGGVARISNWNKDSGRFKNKSKEDFVNWRDKGKRYYYFYTEQEMQKELEEVGFKIISKKTKVQDRPYHSLIFEVRKS